MSKAKTLLGLINLLGKEANRSDAATKVSVDTLEDLISTLENLDGKTEITVTEDLVLEEPLVIPAGAEIIMSLAGKSVTVDKDQYVFENSGTLTISGGTVEGKGVLNTAEGTLTIKDSAKINSLNEEGGTAAIQNEGTCIIVDGEFSVSYVGTVKAAKGVAIVRNNGVLTVQSGNFTSPNMRAYAIINTGEVTMLNEGDTTVAGAHGGFAADRGKVVINGGTYTSTEFYALYVSVDAVEDMEDVEQIPRVEINDGYFQGKKYSIWIGSDDVPQVKGRVIINGGTFMNPVNAEAKVLEGNGIFIYGGKFAQQVDSKYCAEGYVPTTEPDEDGFYTVVKSE